MTDSRVIDWLMEGDPCIGFQTSRDLLGEDRSDLQKQISNRGWGRAYLDRQQPDGHWGRGFYQPKWTSTHYSLLDLRSMCLQQDCESVQKITGKIADEEKCGDGGINPARTVAQSDVCINGMFLSYACWFGIKPEPLHSIIDFILSQRMPDGGFNCRSNRSGAAHSSLHTSLSVCEGLAEYRLQAYDYRLKEIEAAEQSSAEFILKHRLFLSDRTGEIINRKFLNFVFPPRWYFDILRALDYFRYAGFCFDERMSPAIDYLIRKRTPEHLWKLSAAHPGETHINFERAGKPSRWNSMRAMRVLRYFKAG